MCLKNKTERERERERERNSTFQPTRERERERERDVPVVIEFFLQSNQPKCFPGQGLTVYDNYSIRAVVVKIKIFFFGSSYLLVGKLFSHRSLSLSLSVMLVSISPLNLHLIFFFGISSSLA